MINTQDTGAYTLKLFDIVGQEIFSEKSDSIKDCYSQNVNLAGFHKGAYILEIEGDNFTEYISLMIH